MVLMCVACGAEYTISYELNGGINAEANPSTYVKSKEDIVLADPTKNGYMFAGWAEGNIISAKSKEDKVFTATWSAITYNIKYELNGGTLSTPNPSTYTIESPSINLTSPTKLGYKFAGWAEGNGIMSGSTGDKIFTATWELNTYVDCNINCTQCQMFNHYLFLLLLGH